MNHQELQPIPTRRLSSKSARHRPVVHHHALWRHKLKYCFMDEAALISTGLALWQAKGRTINLQVHGTSMAPLILPGDVVCLRLIPPERISRGEVMAFRQNRNIVVHRLIIKKGRNGEWLFCQKGDNLLGWSWIGRDKVLGRIESVRRQNTVMSLTGPRQQAVNRLIVLGEAWLIEACETRWPLKGDRTLRAYPKTISRKMMRAAVKSQSAR
jgi:signal peptidase I